MTALFTDDAEMSDEGETWSGLDEIRAWSTGPLAKYRYTNEVDETEFGDDDDEYVAVGRIKDFPSGRVDLRWLFTLAGVCAYVAPPHPHLPVRPRQLLVVLA